MRPNKVKAGLSMLADARHGEFDAASNLLRKILTNIIDNPQEPKFRKLRTTNAKIATLLATRGVRALLVGAGFDEEGADALVMPEALGPEGAAAALEGLGELVAARVDAAAAELAAELEARKQTLKQNDEKRKLERMQIEEDAAARKEPGWRAKAAGVKGGRDITGCCDIGASGNSGG